MPHALQAQRESLVKAYLEVAERDLMRQSSGNVSCRVDGGMLISCSGASAKNLSTDRVVFVKEDGSLSLIHICRCRRRG